MKKGEGQNAPKKCGEHRGDEQAFKDREGRTCVRENNLLAARDQEFSSAQGCLEPLFKAPQLVQIDHEHSLVLRETAYPMELCA